MFDYNSVRSVSADEFRSRTPTDSEITAGNYTKSDDEDIRKIERILDVREGTLSDHSYYVEYARCECGRVLTMYDVVVGGLLDAGHSKSFVLHTLVGAKFVVSPPRSVRCSESGHPNPEFVLRYRGEAGYGCG